MRRLPTLAVIAALVVVAGLAGRTPGRPRAPVVAVDAMAVAGPASALSSSWFCAGAIAQPAHQADGLLVVANAGARALHGTVTLIPSEGPPVTRPVDVAPFDRSVVVENAAAPTHYLGAVVDLDGGQAVVEQVVTGAEGPSAAACVIRGANRWYFPAGTTQENSTLSVSLLNPYPDDAIADLSFTTDQGVESPQDFQGVLVPAHSLIGVDLGSHLRRRASIAATVSLRIGRVAAFETQVVALAPQAAAAPPNPWPVGVSVVSGAPSPGTAWSWPDGMAADGLTEQYVIYNPGPTEAQLSLAVQLDQGSADPFQLTVEPHAVTAVVTNSESRVPKGVGHAATIRSTNGVGVVAERFVQATAPWSHKGLVQVLGSSAQSRRWLLASGAAVSGFDEWVVAYNPGTTAVTMSVAALSGGGTTPLAQLTDVTVVAGHRAAVRINDHNAGVDHALMVTASGPVVVERDVYPVNSTGLSAALGVPLDQSPVGPRG